MKVSFYALGCKLNQAEVESLSLNFIKQGWQVVEQGADLVIVNTCSVTEKAEKESRQTLRLARHQNPEANLIATGCFRRKNVKEVDKWVIKSDLPEFLRPDFPEEVRPYPCYFAEKVEAPYVSEAVTQSLRGRTRSFIKIQEGCDNFCSFCIVPYLRGRPKSRSAEEIIQEIKEKERMGYKEIVLVGTNVGKYKYSQAEPPNMDLPTLIRKILKETSVPRIRLSSLWPTVVTDDLIALFKNKRLCPHIHLSLQSGSDEILRKMNRNYTTGQVKNVINKLRKKVPEVTLTADIIIAFPGETEKDFKKTCDFVKSIGFLKLHVFRYSARPGTKAAGLSGQIPLKIKQKRSKILRQLSDDFGQKIRKEFAGQARKVLFEEKKRELWQGFTDNYIRVSLRSSEDLRNKIKEVKI